MDRKIKFAPGEHYHVYSRGIEKRKIFLDHKDYKRFMALLYIMNQAPSFHFANFLKSHTLKEIFQEKRGKPLVAVLSYALMPNHFHMLLHEHTEGGISKFMMRLLTAYSMYFNTKYKRSGGLFTHPFRAQHISNESQYLWIFSYIHLNPLGIIRKDFQQIGKTGNRNVVDKFLKAYQYSSYLEYAKVKRAESEILDLSLVPDYLLNVDFSTKKYAEWLEEEGSENMEGSP